MSSFWARPGQPLVRHLQEVAAGARQRLDHPALTGRELLREAAWLVGAAHDVGKYTSFFQKYLAEGVQGRTGGDGTSGLSHHAFPSALVAAWLVQERLSRLPQTSGREFLPLLAYLVVHRHHGRLEAPTALLPRTPREVAGWPAPTDAPPRLARDLKRLARQLEDMRAHLKGVAPELAELGVPEVACFVAEQPIVKVLAQLSGLRHTLEQKIPTQGEEAQLRARLALWGQLLFSALVDADKYSAAGLAPPGRAAIPAGAVDCHLAAAFPQPRHRLDEVRARFFATVQARVEALLAKYDEQEGPLLPVLSLTAPTGMGKTLAALGAALRLRKSLAARRGQAPRIVYVLPFVNLIEQTAGVIRRVLAQGVPGFALDPERYLLQHHHLAEVAYRQSGEALPVEEALLLTESWESEVVVTTLVQLFHTVLGYQNRFLKKFHNLCGAILILDELQSIPMEYWRLAGRVLDVLRRELGVVVVQMTATRPLIFADHERHELYPNPPELFRAQARTRLQVDLTPCTVTELAGRVKEWAAREGSVLVVVNTLAASLALYRELRTRGAGEPYPRPGGQRGLRPEQVLLYLSTNIVPAHRRARLRLLRRWLSAGGQAVVVSTQVVEAGVDLDFPAVVRDLGPVDAVVQVAGRCNREGQRDRATVYVCRLDDPGSVRVYGQLHLNLAAELLNRPDVPETEYSQLVEAYFQAVDPRLDHSESQRLWEAYLHLWYDGGEELPARLSDFALIRPRPEVPIYVPLTPADEAWFRERFVPEVLEEKDLNRRGAAYLAHRRRLHGGVVRPLLQRAEQNLPPQATSSSSLRWVPFNQLNRFYDLETGFLWQGAELNRAAWIE
jgi:CRISPR-associated endonuclease/helicase Cas3